MIAYKTTENDYYDAEKEVYVIYTSCDSKLIHTELRIHDAETTKTWNCYLTEVSLCKCQKTKKGDTQQYRCEYTLF